MNISRFLLKENNNLDIIRIVCASMVIIGHSYAICPAPGKEDVLRMLTGFTYSGAVAVKVFFFISGLLVTDSLLKKQSISGFIISRTFRMMPGLLFVLLLATFIIGPLLSSLTAAHYFTNPVTYTYLLKNVFFFSTYYLPGVFTSNHMKGIVNGSLWSLRYEVRCYMVLLAVFILCKYTIRQYKTVYTIACACIFLYTITMTQLNAINSANTEYTLLPICFAIGSFLAIYKEYIVIDYKALLLFTLLTALLWHTKFSEVAFTISCCLLVIVIAANQYARRLKIKNDISYGVYLWGFLIQQALFHFTGYQDVYLFMLCSIALSLLMGFASYVLVEKRFMNYGREWSKRFMREAATP